MTSSHHSAPPAPIAVPAAGVPIRDTPLTVTLPADYTAFCVRNQQAYITYARARSQDAQLARRIVESVLSALVVIWPTVIASDRPASVAWRMLSTQVAAATRQARRQRKDRVRDTMHSTLPAEQADVLLLRYRLNLSWAQTAELMGLEESEVAFQLARGISRLTDADTESGSTSVFT
ncbi:sigma factor-like helix-turn-helix DNA-binding protein [Streptomyces sp. NBC_00273]|uniref:sigma factor-like helix-turn-helix DNA-binding protein n=1 Tax=Streptomyces sp. NBC_00273 TaxID=2903644 RepID=UPI002E2B6237|nr:sigma factor-like helix-turn-helix DNA-binding protein [Streptomyces sp. NBC_00273]